MLEPPLACVTLTAPYTRRPRRSQTVPTLERTFGRLTASSTCHGDVACAECVCSAATAGSCLCQQCHRAQSYGTRVGCLLAKVLKPVAWLLLVAVADYLLHGVTCVTACFATLDEHATQATHSCDQACTSACDHLVTGIGFMLLDDAKALKAARRRLKAASKYVCGGTGVCGLLPDCEIDTKYFVVPCAQEISTCCDM